MSLYFEKSDWIICIWLHLHYTRKWFTQNWKSKLKNAGNQFWLSLYGQNSVFHRNYPWCAIFAGEQYGCAGLCWSFQQRCLHLNILCLLCLFWEKKIGMCYCGGQAHTFFDIQIFLFIYQDLIDLQICSEQFDWSFFGLRKAGFMLWWSWMPPKNYLVLI